MPILCFQISKLILKCVLFFFFALQYEHLEIQNDEERTQFLQRVLLDYLAVKSLNDESQLFARHFYICQWYQDSLNELNTTPSKVGKNAKKPKKKSKKRWKDGE